MDGYGYGMLQFFSVRHNGRGGIDKQDIDFTMSRHVPVWADPSITPLLPVSAAVSCEVVRWWGWCMFLYYVCGESTF